MLLIAFYVAIGWAIFASITAVYLYRFHYRASFNFPCTSKEAQRTMVQLLETQFGIFPVKRMVSRSMQGAVLKNNAVIIYSDLLCGQGRTRAEFIVNAADPQDAAQKVIHLLALKSYACEIVPDNSKNSGSVRLNSTAFSGWDLIITKPLYQLPVQVTGWNWNRASN